MSCNCKFGPHVSVKNTIYDTLLTVPPECKCCQIFIGNPQSYTVRKISQDDANRTREYLEEKKMKLYVHSNYLINLAREGDESIVTKSRNCLQNTIDELHKIGGDYTGTVLHIGARGTIQNVVEQLNDMDVKVPIYLENSAGEGTKLGNNMDELRKLIEGCDSNKMSLCIDTCHAFSAGMVDFREDSAVEKFFEDMSFASDRNWIFHVNDSTTPFFGKVDRHSPVGFGHIWNLNVNGSLERLQRFYELASSVGKDIVFETPNPVTSQLESGMLLNL